MDNAFFDGWAGLFRILAFSILAYPALIMMLRISGKRTLGKMNAFDLVITVALGSTFATVLLNKDLPLAEGLLALGMLVLLQFAITWLSVRSDFVRRLVKSQPTVLVHAGASLDEVLRGQRVTKDELDAALRGQGLADVGHAARVTLETDGTLSVVRKPDDDGGVSGPTA